MPSDLAPLGWLFPRRRRVPPRIPDTFAYTIRPAVAADLPHVRAIYDHYVTNTVITFDEKPSTLRFWRDKFAALSRAKLPFLVAVSPSGQVLGYALVQPWASKSAYRYTVENSIYLGPSAGGKGLGTALLQALIDASIEAGLREIVAVVSDSGAEGSLALHRKFGFVEVGRMGGVGYKFGRSLGTVYLQKSLPRRSR
ncbi:phosphinothricin acetyltransferase [Microbacterium keratanolyticum]|uniref:N-acetyltransferase n=1 Tax=Microbacterium keratanolyticum TaxID=67574 RepID=A0A9W6HUG1_9MICO|nr:phosphinothricin acetyltransferase [Microbacterium keratanolyticum]GLK02853.1 N-acetyltransferase [Microbacterium keratanolyticum]